MCQPVIVELGAYCGEDGPVFQKLAHPSDILHIMVEPDPKNVAVIQLRPLDANRRLVAAAISDKMEEREFRFSYDSRDESRGSGSIRNPTGHLKHFPTISFSAPQMVKCLPLDFVFIQERLSRIDLLWVDIQGAERDMIAGGAYALAKTRYVFMEAEEIELYEGQALKPELIQMFGPSWTLMKDFGYNILLRNDKFA